MGWWGVLWKIEIGGFGDVGVGMAYKCPQTNTMEVLVHEIFELCGFCTGPIWRCSTTKLDGLVGSFVKKWNSLFLRSEGWNDLQMPPNEYHECLGLWFAWVLHMANLAVWHDTTWWLSGKFCEKMKFFVFEMWRLEWPPNAPKWIPRRSWCTKVLSCIGFAHAQVLRCGTT